MATLTRETSAVRSLAMGVILFSAGMCSADGLRYRIANARADHELPRASVAYNQQGTYVNGERVRANGLIGGPRCEVDSLAPEVQRAVAVNIMQKQPRVIGDYATQIGAQAWRSLMYQTLKGEMETDSVRGVLAPYLQR